MKTYLELLEEEMMKARPICGVTLPGLMLAKKLYEQSINSNKEKTCGWCKIKVATNKCIECKMDLCEDCRMDHSIEMHSDDYR